MTKTQVILINVGTPNAPDPQSVGNYLNEFLMDENIISIPRPFRDILVKALIVPKRKYASAEKYQSIWHKEGSPLMIETRSLQASLQAKLGESYRVRIAMQVGQPRLSDELKLAKESGGKIILIPLYPQFAQATTGGALQIADRILGKGQYQWIPAFFAEDWFIQAQVEKIKASITPKDYLLLSFHGLPVSHLSKMNKDCGKTADCCLQAQSCAKNCYKAQCLKTSKKIVQHFPNYQIGISFQSRLGRGEWIGPATSDVVIELVKKGIKHLKVACPSFVADCLETLEEIGIELRHEFLAAGGESFELITCVNDSETFVAGIQKRCEAISNN